MKANLYQQQARFQAASLGCLIVVVLASLLVNTTALGGTIRYDLPELLGEHRYDGQSLALAFWGRTAQVQTPLGFSSASQAKLVVEGSVTPGKARGDGVIREALEFTLEPRVHVIPNFPRQFYLSGETTSDLFRIEEIYPHPFVPNVPPLPNPDGYPPVSFFISFSVFPGPTTNYPPRLVPIDDSNLLLWNQEIIVDVPIIANVTEAYIILTGPGIVPEPSAGVLLLVGAVMPILFCRGRRAACTASH